MNAPLALQRDRGERPEPAPRRPPSVLAVRGWVCDRYSSGGMHGASLMARHVARQLGAPLMELGEPEDACDLGWRESLAKAKPFLKTVASELSGEIRRGFRPMVFANRCGASIATIAAALKRHPRAVVVWCDAHGDFNTPETTPTGYLGGMVLTALCGLWDSGLGNGLSPDRLVLVGARDLDPAEKALLERHGVRTFVTSEPFVDPRPIAEAVAGRPVWLHVDTDILDPDHVPAEYRVPGGLHPEGLRAILGAIMAASDVVGYEMTEFEAPADPARQRQALAVLMDTIRPVIEGFSAADRLG